ANAMFPKEEFILHRASGSSALHSDIFRYHMIQRTGLVWVDCDMLCMRPWVFPSGHVYGWEKPKRLICGAALGFPAGSEALKELIAFCEDPAPIPDWYTEEEKARLGAAAAEGNPVHVSDLPWGIWGPAALTHYLRATGEAKNALPQEAFYPIPFKDRRDMLDPEVDIAPRLGEGCYGVHLWNRRLRRRLVTHHGGIPEPASFVGQAVARHGIDCGPAPIPDIPPASVLAARAAAAEAKAKAAAEEAARAAAQPAAPLPPPDPPAPAAPAPAPGAADAAAVEPQTPRSAAPKPLQIAPRLWRDAVDPAADAIQDTPPAALAELELRPPVHMVRKFRRQSEGLELMLRHRGPWLAPPAEPPGREKILVVTAMKNEAPFILEWIAYNRLIGVDHFLVYTNDCSDNTVAILDRLAALGIVTRRDNPYVPGGKVKPQHAALRDAPKQKVYKEADWIITIDLDEFIAIHVGDGTLHDLFLASNHPNAVSLTWKFFGNGGVIDYEDRPVIEQFTRCAPEVPPDPGLAWGFKTMFNRRTCRFRKLGVHRPTKMVEGAEDAVRWVNGSGRVMPKRLIEKGWRTVQPIFGYRLATLNHYAVRSADSYLVKRDRGRINHTAQDQGVYYFQRRNYIAEDDSRLLPILPRLEAERARLMSDPALAALHEEAVAWHKARIARLKADPDYARVYSELVRTAGEDATFFTKADPAAEPEKAEAPPAPVPHD
ncbi:MAG: glycosyltransferase family 2 protein, partial [Paracoccaceae bacterium]|nr:glycosyltransferase family 2 protein [Paracoccaceae bacterium]